MRAAADGEVDDDDTMGSTPAVRRRRPLDKIEAFVKILPVRMIRAQVQNAMPLVFEHELGGGMLGNASVKSSIKFVIARSTLQMTCAGCARCRSLEDAAADASPADAPSANAPPAYARCVRVRPPLCRQTSAVTTTAATDTPTTIAAGSGAARGGVSARVMRSRSSG